VFIVINEYDKYCYYTCMSKFVLHFTNKTTKTSYIIPTILPVFSYSYALGNYYENRKSLRMKYQLNTICHQNDQNHPNILST